MAVKSRKVSKTVRHNYDAQGRLTSITYGRQGHTHNVKTSAHPSNRSKRKTKLSAGSVFLIIILAMILSIFDSCSSSDKQETQRTYTESVNSQEKAKAQSEIDAIVDKKPTVNTPAKKDEKSYSIRQQVF